MDDKQLLSELRRRFDVPVDDLSDEKLLDAYRGTLTEALVRLHCAMRAFCRAALAAIEELGYEVHPDVGDGGEIRDVEYVPVPRRQPATVRLVPSKMLELFKRHQSQDKLFPVKAGWKFSKCDAAYLEACRLEEFRMGALEALYTAVDPGGGGIKLPGHVENKERAKRLLDELAVMLVGGVPEEREENT